MLSRSNVVIGVACLALGCGEKPAPSAPTPAPPAPVLFQTIAELSFPNPVQVGPAALAQSVTPPAGAAFDHIRFRWTPSRGAPPLEGTLYIIGSLTGGDTSYLRAFLNTQNDRIDAGFTLRGARVQ